MQRRKFARLRNGTEKKLNNHSREESNGTGQKNMTLEISSKAKERMLSEELLGPKELAKVTGITAGKLKNMIYHGLVGASKKTVRLERVRTEGGPKSSVRALERFRKRLNDATWDGTYE